MDGILKKRYDASVLHLRIYIYIYIYIYSCTYSGGGLFQGTAQNSACLSAHDKLNFAKSTNGCESACIQNHGVHSKTVANITHALILMTKEFHFQENRLLLYYIQPQAYIVTQINKLLPILL